MKKWISAPAQFFFKNIYNALAWFISGILLLAVITKLLDPSDFSIVLIEHTFIPLPLVKAAAAVILGAEVLIAVSLITPKLRCFGAPAAFFLFTGFTVFKVYHFIFDTGANCGCFGPLGPERVNLPDILINTILVILGLMLWQKNDQFLKCILPEKSHN